MFKNLIGALVLASIPALAIAQQTGSGTPRRGNPTPGVEQPPPPKIEDRITVSGCLTRVGQPATDPNSFSDSRFVITNAKRENKGIRGAGTSPAAAAATANRFRLAGVDTSFAPFVGTQVEISGEVIAPADGNGTALKAEFVQKLAARCQ
jgi:hypothetical protein